jgi:hypothetical protein
MEIYGLLIFLAGAGYTALQLHNQSKALNADRRAVWKRAEDLLRMREAEQTKRQELNQGFDWKNNLPMILSFLGGKGIDTSNIDMEEVQNLLSTMEDK